METSPPDRQIQELLARNIKEARRKLGISQMELAKRADISAGHMNDIEACRRWVSSLSFAKIATELHLKPYQLLLDEDDQSFDKYDLFDRDSLQTSQRSGLRDRTDHPEPYVGSQEKALLRSSLLGAADSNRYVESGLDGYDLQGALYLQLCNFRAFFFRQQQRSVPIFQKESLPQKASYPAI